MSDEIKDKSRKYILITACKNEGDNIPDLLQSLAEQTVRPVLWVIMDDGSTDNTPDIIKEAREKYDWIQNIQLEESERDLGLHLADVIRRGFNYAIEYCIKNKIDYDYLGNVDGDLILDNSFFEILINGFENDPTLGVASGCTKHIIGDCIKYAKGEEDEPSGGHMLLRRECFEEIGGFPLSYAPDSVLKAKARLRGWKTKRFEESIATEIRDVNAAEGYWKGFVYKGKTSYYLNHNPLQVIIRIFIYTFRRPYYIGIAYLSGYLISFLKRSERINDIEIRRYFWNKWKEVIKKRLGS